MKEFNRNPKQTQNHVSAQAATLISEGMVLFPEGMVLSPGQGKDVSAAMIIEKIPPEVAGWMGMTQAEAQEKSVDEVFGHVGGELSSLAKEMLTHGLSGCEHSLEFVDSRGKSRVALVRARLGKGQFSEKVIMHFKDITPASDQNLQTEGNFLGIIGSSTPMKNVFHKINLYGPAEAPVIITGETGTGKELIARALHERSKRRQMPFVAVNCCALSEDLFESELFGHERGSFTGAVKTHKGRFERADKGTLFLDEIGDMPIRTQAKLLRVLEEGTIERVGGEEEYPVDVRIIAATNISLEQAVAVRRFRADLYHRLAVFRIHVPPLRDRPGDIALLVEHFLKILNQRYNRRVLRLTPEALRVLEDYHWAGNVRELRNVLERVYVESRGIVIGHNSLNEWVQERDYFSAGEWNLYFPENQKAAKPAIIVPHTPAGQHPREVALLPFKADTPLHTEDKGSSSQSDLPDRIASGGHDLLSGRLSPYERRYNPPIDIAYTGTAASTRPKKLTREIVIDAFQTAEGNITQAARLLGVHKATLYRYMKNIGLNREILNLQSKEE